MLLHRLEPWEAERLRTVRLAALADSPDAFCTTADEALGWGDERWNAQVEQLPTFIVAQSTVSGLERDVGMVRVFRHQDQADTAVLISMWVAPASRGGVAAGMLVDAVAEWAANNECARVVLEVAKSNRRAQAFYAKRGFVPTGRADAMPRPRQNTRLEELVLVVG